MWSDLFEHAWDRLTAVWELSRGYWQRMSEQDFFSFELGAGADGGPRAG